MRLRILAPVLALGLLIGLRLAALGQAPTTGPAVPSAPASRTTTPATGRDLTKLKPMQRQAYLSAQSGADWLYRCNRPDGKFNYGILPDLRTPLEGDNYLRQAGAAYALAAASRVTGDERHAAVARQAVLTLLLETTAETGPSGKVRHTTLPSSFANRLGAAGMLVLAINELPSPAEDLLEQSEELCRFIQSQQQPDGSLAIGVPADAKGSVADPDAVNVYPGQALYALMRSQQYRPAPWKTEAVLKALAYYRSCWEKNKNADFAVWQAAAYAELFAQAQGKERGCAEFVGAMADWLVGMQYTTLDPRHPLWLGGFMPSADGKPTADAPTISSAGCTAVLVAGCRTAKQAGDVQRYQRYRDAVERSLQFLSTLQYTDGNTQHFADGYRQLLVGGFHPSHQSGTLRIDYTQQAVCTLLQYLNYVDD